MLRRTPTRCTCTASTRCQFSVGNGFSTASPPPAACAKTSKKTYDGERKPGGEPLNPGREPGGEPGGETRAIGLLIQQQESLSRTAIAWDFKGSAPLPRIAPHRQSSREGHELDRVATPPRQR